jgi:hypothetical protein
MKRIFAVVTRVLIVFCVCAVVIFGLLYWIGLAYSDFSHAVRTHKDLKAFVDANVEYKAIYRFEIGGSSCIWWEMDIPRIFVPVPSGPPVCIFDESGTLVDYTADIGDDNRFREKWATRSAALHNRKEISWDELLLLLSVDVHDTENSDEDEVPDDLLTEPQS